MQELLLKCNHLFLLHFFTIIASPKGCTWSFFAGPKLKFRPKKSGFALKFLSDIRSAAGELFTGPHQSLPEMSDGPTAIGEHWKECTK